MKPLHLLQMASFAALFSSVSCQNEQFDDWSTPQQDGCKSIEVTMPPFEAGIDTKMAYDNTSLALSWLPTDTIGIFPGKGDQVSFSMSGGSGNVAIFTGGGWALKKNSTYYAYYPFNRACYAGEHMKNRIPISLLGQTQVGDNNTAHLGKYTYMYSDGTVPDDGAVNLQLHHATVIMKMNLTLPIDAVVMSVSLEVLDNDASFYVGGTMNLCPHFSPIVQVNQFAKQMKLPCKNLLAKGNTPFTTYMALLPINLMSKDICISVITADEKEYISEFQPSKEWVAGNYYSITKTLVESNTQLLNNPTAQSVIKTSTKELKVTGVLSEGFWERICEAVQQKALRTLDLKEATIESNAITTQLQSCTKLEKLLLPNNVEHISLSGLPQLSFLRIGDHTKYIEELSGSPSDANYCSPKQDDYNHKNPTFYQNFRNTLLKFGQIEISNINTSYALRESFFCIVKDGKWSAIACLEDQSITQIRMNYDYAALEGTFCGFSNLEYVEFVGEANDGYGKGFEWDLHLIGSYTFYNCSKLRAFANPHCIDFYRFTGLGTIEPFAFENCTSIETIQLPALDSESYRGQLRYLDGFSGCTNLQTVNPGDSECFTQIGASAFTGCIKLKSFIFDSCYNGEIGGDDAKYEVLRRGRSGAFCGCTSLASVTLYNVKSIASGSFLDCYALRDLYCNMTTPPTITHDTFSVQGECRLHVPEEAEYSYCSDEYWSRFFYYPDPNDPPAEAPDIDGL